MQNYQKIGNAKLLKNETENSSTYFFYKKPVYKKLEAGAP